jgi:hypothetical protein
VFAQQPQNQMGRVGYHLTAMFGLVIAVAKSIRESQLVIEGLFDVR